MTSASPRVHALDVFRGLAMAAMIVVNNPGNWNAVYPPLAHAPWNGWTLADIVFPSFVFIVGVTLPITRTWHVRRDTRTALQAVMRRAMMLVGLGLVLNAVMAFPDLAVVRIPGVLQRIGLAYALAAPVILLSRERVWLGALALLLAAHSALVLRVPFGGSPAGTLTPSHNLPGYVDAILFGRHMLYAVERSRGAARYAVHGSDHALWRRRGRLAAGHIGPQAPSRRPGGWRHDVARARPHLVPVAAAQQDESGPDRLPSPRRASPRSSSRPATTSWMCTSIAPGCSRSCGSASTRSRSTASRNWPATGSMSV